MSHESSKLLTDAAGLIETGLRNAYQVHEDLGPKGTEAVEENQFGDQAMVADVRSERTMLHVLEESGLNFTVHSEEHGKLDIAGISDDSPRLLAVMDGLDGSSLYKKARGKGNYGTMFALFENDNPYYDQYFAAGIMLHSTAQLLLATRGRGVQVTNLLSDTRTSAITSSSSLSYDALLYTDDDASVPRGNALYRYFQTNLKRFAEPLRREGYSPTRTGASAGYYADLAMGKALMVGEATRKGNLELAAAYAIVREAGGSILDIKSGQDIANKRFLEYGQTSHEPFMAVANPHVAEQLTKIIEG